MRGPAVLGLDAGGSVVKATVFPLQDDVPPVTVSKALATSHPHPGYAERDGDTLWGGAAEVVRSVLKRVPHAEITSIGVTGHGNGLYLADKNGELVCPAVLAADTRAATIAAQVDREALRSLTWNSVWSGQPLPSLSWLTQHPEYADLSSAFIAFGCKDFLRGKLTGVLSSELTDYSASGVLDNLTGNVSWEALAAYGLESYSHLFPPPVEPQTKSGYTTSEAYRTTGLHPGIPVIAGVVDNVALQLGSGVTDSSALCVSAGTWSVNQLALPIEQVLSKNVLPQVRPLAAGRTLPLGMAMLGEASATSASVFAWALREVWPEISTPEASVYDVAFERAFAVSVKDDSPFFLPFLSGSRFDAHANAAWLGISAHHSQADLLAAILEGICFEHRRHIERFAEFAPTPVHLSGGATKSAHWCQLFADVLFREVQVFSTSEIGSIGVAALAAAPQSLSAMIEIQSHWAGPTTTFRPHPERAKLLDRRYARYRTYTHG